MKPLLIASLILPLTGCAALSAVGLTPASAPFLTAVAVETRAGAEVIRASARGDALGVRLHCFRIRQARIGFNGTAGLQLSDLVRHELEESRVLTERVCAEAGVPLPFTPEARP